MQRYLSVKDIAKLYQKSAEHIRAIISREKIKPSHCIRTKCKSFGGASTATYSASVTTKLYDSLAFERYFTLMVTE